VLQREGIHSRRRIQLPLRQQPIELALGEASILLRQTRDQLQGRKRVHSGRRIQLPFWPAFDLDLAEAQLLLLQRRTSSRLQQRTAWTLTWWPVYRAPGRSRGDDR